MNIDEVNKLIDSPKWKTKRVLYYVKSVSKERMGFSYFCSKRDVDVFLKTEAKNDIIIGVYRMEKVNGHWETNNFYRYTGE